MIALQNMRMACDSTYLLDHKNDFSVKPDDLTTLLGELFEQPQTKVVIFSQWLRMHELLERRMQDREWQYVLFHGGVPSEQRKQLVDRFREDPACRAFLSTDAGGVGLNLQHANVVINVDLPWNPAVLEQRIGRVHRLGQTQPVQVYNFVAQGSIEEGMLSLLKFKKSLFAGVLDGGEKEVFLGGSRLTQFMETVEKVTTSIPEGMPADEPSVLEEEPRRPSATGQPQPSADVPVPMPTGRPPRAASEAATSDPLANFLSSGLAIVEQLTRMADAPQSASGSKAPSDGAAPLRMVQDERSGQSYLQIALPQREVLHRFLDNLRELLQPRA
jgi:hypothetical protein